MGHGALYTTIHMQLILLYLLLFVDGYSISLLLKVNITFTICDLDCFVFIVTAALHVYCYSYIDSNFEVFLTVHHCILVDCFKLPT